MNIDNLSHGSLVHFVLQQCPMVSLRTCLHLSMVACAYIPAFSKDSLASFIKHCSSLVSPTLCFYVSSYKTKFHSIRRLFIKIWRGRRRRTLSIVVKIFAKSLAAIHCPEWGKERTSIFQAGILCPLVDISSSDSNISSGVKRSVNGT